MSEEQQRTEILRLLACQSRKTSPLDILQVDIATCAVADVNKSFRKIALLLHPDKCTLPNASDAFNVAEKAHKMLSQEAVLAHLKRAHEKKEGMQGTTSAGPSQKTSSASASAPAAVPAAAAASSGSGGLEFGTLSKLAVKGLSTDAQKAAEIRRILQCKSSDYFVIFDVNPAECEVPDIDRRYRRMAQALHPDKCQLPHVVDAFNVFEKAHKELSDEKKLVRYKLGYIQQRKHAAALEAEAARRQSQATAAAAASGGMTGLSEEEQRELRMKQVLREHQMEAARLADEAARKKRKVEAAEAETKELASELERQRQEWRDMDLF